MSRRLKGISAFSPLNAKINRVLVKVFWSFPLDVYAFIEHLVKKYKKIKEDVLEYYFNNFFKVFTKDEIYLLMKQAKEPEYFLAAIIENNKLLHWLKQETSDAYYYTNYLIPKDAGSSFRQMHLGWLKYKQHINAVFTKTINKSISEEIVGDMEPILGLYEIYVDEITQEIKLNSDV